MKPIAALGYILLLTGSANTAAQQKVTHSIAPEDSKIEVHVYKEGIFKAFGHDHLIAAKGVSGQVLFDPQKIENSTVRLRVDANSLLVLDPGESQEGRQGVQSTMNSDKVLDVTRFREIVFTSTGLSSAKKTAAGWEVTLSGMLKLHGVEKPVSFPLHVHAEGSQLKAEGEVVLLQSEYGITPIRVGGGAVKVKDKVKISFAIQASTTNP